MKDSAIDFLTKPVDADALLDAVQRSVAIDQACRARVAGDHALAAALDTLTPREREMLPYLVAGRLNKQGASDFGVVEKTVKVHRGRVMFKFGTRSLFHLVRIAERLHIEPKGVGSRRLPTTPAGQVARFEPAPWVIPRCRRPRHGRLRTGTRVCLKALSRLGTGDGL